MLGRTKPPDRLAAIFHQQTDLATAIARAGELLGPADGATVRATFDALRPKLDVLLAESRAFEGIAAKLQARLDDPKASAYVARLAKFYGSSDLGRFTVAFVWWPPIDGMTASLAGDVLLLRYHPIKHSDIASRKVDIPMHEVVHFVSTHQPEARKASLSAAFRSKCNPSPKLAPVRLFEEPLAVAHQKMFLADFEPAAFDRAQAWYGDPWVSAMAKLTYDPLLQAHREGRVLDDRLAADVGRSCRELTAVGKELAR